MPYKNKIPKTEATQNMINYICLFPFHVHRYRMLYKPMFKVAHKTVTELEWRCCPGFTGVGCNSIPTAYGMKAMPPFQDQMPSYKGPRPSHKGLQPSYKGLHPNFKGPLSSSQGSKSSFKGPMPAFKGRMPSYIDPVNAYEEKAPFYKGQMPPFYGPMSQPNHNRNLWNQPLSPSNIMDENSGPDTAPSYPGASFEPYLEPGMDHPDTVLEQENPLINMEEAEQDPISDAQESIGNYQDPIPDQQQSILHPEPKPVPETPADSSKSEINHGEIKICFNNSTCMFQYNK